jgi:hypothetical protein
MIVRRAFYYWQFIAAIALPVWLLVGWGVFGGSGWGLIGLLVVCPVAFLALIAIASLIFARKQVRAQRAVSWLDVGILTAWHLAIVGIGFYGPGATWFAVGAVVLGVAAFWIVVWELLTETRKRVASVFERIEEAAQAPSTLGPRGAFSEDSDVIVIREGDTGDRRW